MITDHELKSMINSHPVLKKSHEKQCNLGDARPEMKDPRDMMTPRCPARPESCQAHRLQIQMLRTYQEKTEDTLSERKSLLEKHGSIRGGCLLLS